MNTYNYMHDSAAHVFYSTSCTIKHTDNSNQKFTKALIHNTGYSVAIFSVFLQNELIMKRMSPKTKRF